jgi:lipoyl(octanoyl) transferase
VNVAHHSFHNTFADGTVPAGRPARHGVLITIQTPMRYEAGWALQQRLHAECLSGRRGDTLVLLQHVPVYTIGRRTKQAHVGLGVLPNIPVVPASRGGSVTYHGPGQLVGYPIVVLSHHAAGARAYVHMLEEVLIRTLACWGIHGYRLSKTPGVWARSAGRESKLASIGARIDHGITLHGFALNVDLDLSPFAAIVPCGLTGCRMTSMAELIQSTVSIPLVAEQIAQEFSSVFGLEWTEPRAESMLPAPPEQHLAVAATVEA